MNPQQQDTISELKELLKDENPDWRDVINNAIEALQSPWISVEDDLPTEGRVILYTPTHTEPYRLVPWDMVRQMTDATHWQPITPPEIGK